MKASARDLLAKLKTDCLVLDWRHRQQTRAAGRITIERVLDEELPDAYDPELFQDKCDLMYHHLYHNHYDNGTSVYSQAA